MTSSPWPMRVGGLVLREAAPADIEQLLTFRNDPAVNRFMVRTSVDPFVLTCAASGRLGRRDQPVGPAE